MSKKQLCVICGKNLATTRDHIPPKSIFPKPRPGDLITVPACKECNNGDSIYDETFKVYANLHVLRGKDNWEEIFRKNILPSIKHNKKLLHEILSNSRDVYVKTPAGIELGYMKGVKWNSGAFKTVIERTIRGLHWYHTGEIIGDKAIVKPIFLGNIERPAEAFNIVKVQSIANNKFQYKYLYTEESPYYSAWLFIYEGLLWVGGAVVPPDKKGETPLL